MNPLNRVHDETIYAVLHGDSASRSWFEKCNELEAALVEGGWLAPSGHPLAKCGLCALGFPPFQAMGQRWHQVNGLDPFPCSPAVGVKK